MEHPKFSNFHITVNLNSGDPEYLDGLREAVEHMKDFEYLGWWLKQYDGTGQVDFDDNTWELVDDVRLRCGLESEGEQNKGIHAHILVEIRHYTMVQINKTGLLDVIKKFVHWRLNPNVHIRFIPGKGEDKEYILHYITKERPTCPRTRAQIGLVRAMERADIHQEDDGLQ